MEVYDNNLVYEMKFDTLKSIIVLNNLIGNVKKFNASVVQVFITEDKNKEVVSIKYISKNSIQENMDADKIFEYGYSSKRRGTGNGLFMVKKILTNDFNGNIKYIKGKGNDFILHIK